jgi:hypothetical protein
VNKIDRANLEKSLASCSKEIHKIYTAHDLKERTDDVYSKGRGVR